MEGRIQYNYLIANCLEWTNYCDIGEGAGLNFWLLINFNFE
jgi:hypothetical protein